MEKAVVSKGGGFMTIKPTHLLLIVGFGCAVAWSPTLRMVAAPENAFNVLANKPPHGACIPSLIGSILTCIIIFFGGKKGFLFFEYKINLLCLGAAMALMGAVFLLPLVTQNSISVAGGVINAISGILVTILYLFWMRVFGKLSEQEMFLTLLLSQVLTCAINAALSVTNMYTVLVASVLLPLVSAACLQMGRRKVDSASGDVPSVQNTSTPIPTKLLVKLVVIVLIWGVVDHLFRGEFDATMRMQLSGSPFTIAYHATAFAMMVVAVGAVYTLIVFKERFQFGHLYRVFFLLGLASILLLPIVLSGHVAILGYACSAVVYQLVFLFMWVIAASVFRSGSLHAPGFFGLMYGFWSLGSLGGALFSSLLVQHLSMENVHIAVLFAALVVVFGYTLVFTENDANMLVKIIPFKHKAPFKEKCSAIAKAYKLSPRETEIAILIAQGRDSSHIEQKLFLSRSTVQTHRMHIYQKLNIHNRQELLDVIEHFEGVSPVKLAE